MNFDRLTALLLDRAIRGELVPQFDGEPVVEQIGEAPKDVPFAIPRKWKWVRLSDLGKLTTGSTPKTSEREFYGGSFPFIKPSEISSDGMLTLKPSLSDIGKKAARVVGPGTVLMVCIGTIGKTAVAPEPLAFNQQINAIEPNDKVIGSDFLYFVFRSDWFQCCLKEASSATILPIVNKSRWGSSLIPLPPVEEQGRIARKLDELLEKVSRAKVAYEELCKYSESLRKRILQEAMRGELVPQLDAEPAVEQIGEAPKDVPFAIPGKWKWCHLLDVFEVYQPKTISTRELSDNGEYLVYGANGVIGKYTDYNHESSEVVIACRGATCGAVNLTKPKSWINGNAMVVRPCKGVVCQEYLIAFLKSFSWKKVTSGSAQPQITRKNLSSVSFPLPPIEEQRRIVRKLNELLGEVEKISA